MRVKVNIVDIRPFEVNYSLKKLVSTKDLH